MLVLKLTIGIDGAGAMLFSPISEAPSVGRNIPYVTSFALFVVFSALAAMRQSFPVLIVMRFVQGFFGSPALATGGASMQDMVRKSSELRGCLSNDCGLVRASSRTIRVSRMDGIGDMWTSFGANYLCFQCLS